MIIWVDGCFGSEFAAEETDSSIGNDFVDVHVELSAGTGLPDYEREVIVQFAFRDFLGSGLDCLGDFLVETVLLT